MVLNILKKDLKRKKVTNIVLLLFMILAAMFVSSSIFNMVAMTNSLDSFFEKAKVADYFIASNENENQSIENFLEKNEELIEHTTSSKAPIVAKDVLKSAHGETISSVNPMWITTTDFINQVIFDQGNNPINNIKEGEIYVTNKFLNNFDVTIGEKIYIEENGYKKEFIIADLYKDAYLGTAMVGIDRIVISDQDMEELNENIEFNHHGVTTINTSDLSKFTEILEKAELEGLMFLGDRDLIAMTYILDMVIAMMLFAVSICFVVISLIIVKFSIGFTISQEFREIGIMKAIGIKNSRIRKIYIVKYLCLSMIGFLIGYLLSFPFAALLLDKVSKSMVLEVGLIGYVISLIAMVLLGIIIQFFCYQCTKTIVKLSPIQAISNGNSGERYQKKGIIRLHKSRLKPSSFLAINDVCSNPKRFLSLAMIFMIGTIIILLPTTAGSTLNSGEMAFQMGFYPGDLMITDSDGLLESAKVNRVSDYLEEQITLLLELSKEHGQEAEITTTLLMTNKATYQEKSVNHVIFQHQNLTLDQFDYTEGSVPMDQDEVAITKFTAEKLGVVIGDTITMDFGNGEESFLITAYFQTMMNMGQGIRIHQDVFVKNVSAIGLYFQLDFENDLTNKEVIRMQQILQEELPTHTVDTGSGFVSTMTGGSPEMMSQLGTMMLVIIVLINILVTILVVTSFIMKETGEIAILKAIGFSNRCIRKWQTLRIGVVLVCSILLGIILSVPLNRVVLGGIFGMMGLEHVTFVVDYVQLYVIYPLILLSTTLFASFIASRQIDKIKTSEINTVE